MFHTGNPLLILAGAGSGKTRVITTKIAYLIREHGVEPWSILAVTFTNKAAREMADRARLIDQRAGDAMLRTFHSFGAWFLRRNGSFGGLSSNFVIYDDDDSVSLLATIMEDAPRAEVKQTAHHIARAKDYFLSPDDPDLDMLIVTDHQNSFRKIYAQYEERLRQIGNVDFGDLIKKPVEILRSHPEIAGRFRDRFKVILVDEYQDSNIAQFELLKEIYGPQTYLCVVGDDDQSIYRFRGAEVRNILEFPDRFPGTDIIRLERNYRSTTPILAAAASVVDHNQGRLGKTLRSERGPGKKPVLAFLQDQDEETSFCAELIENSVRGGKDGQKAAYSDWAVLYRTNAQSLGFETEFLRRRIPYKVVGSLKFYEREEVKDALALLSFLVNSRDEVAFRRVVNKPSRGAGAATVDRITALAAAGDGDLTAASMRLKASLSSKARSGLDVFFAALEKGAAALTEADESGESDDPEKARQERKKPKVPKKREDLSAGEGLSVCVVTLVKETGLDVYHQTHDEIAGNQRIANLQELANAASIYPASRRGLLDFLENIELDRAMQDPGDEAGIDTVTLITLHNTKGLEFRRVILTGIEQGVFPRDDKKGDDLEEERRLFYVGATRAMDELYLCSSAFRRMYGQTMKTEPSVFLREIDQTLLRIIGTAPYGFANNPVDSKADGKANNRTSRGVPGSAYPGGKVSSDGRWRVGDRIFHDDHGYGGVAEIRESDEGPVIHVRFETGRDMRFLSLHQSSKIVKVTDDY